MVRRIWWTITLTLHEILTSRFLCLFGHVVITFSKQGINLAGGTTVEMPILLNTVQCPGRIERLRYDNQVPAEG